MAKTGGVSSSSCFAFEKVATPILMRTAARTVEMVDEQLGVADVGLIHHCQVDMHYENDLDVGKIGRHNAVSELALGEGDSNAGFVEVAVKEYEQGAELVVGRNDFGVAGRIDYEAVVAFVDKEGDAEPAAAAAGAPAA